MWILLAALLLMGCGDPCMDLEIKPLRGLWRTPNELAAPAGSCRTLNNCCIRKQGVIEPLPDLQDQGYEEPSYNPCRMFDVPGDDILTIWKSGAAFKTLWIDKAAGTSTTVTLPDGSNPTYEDGAASLVRYRDRYYLTSKQGLLVLDSAGDTTARRAGFPPPRRWNSISETNTDAQAIADTKFVGYRAIFERELSDGSVVSSAPLSSIVYENDTGSTSDTTVQVNWDGGSGEPWQELAAGDFVALYRTDQAGTSAVGDVMRLVKRVELTSTDITNEYIDITDAVPDVDLGGELYTNPGQKGASKAHSTPPYLRDVVYYNGILIGIAHEEAQSIRVRIPGKLGELTSDAERLTGIGTRNVTGDTSIGTDTITNVSASHMKGIIAGQRVSHPDFPATTNVLSAAGSTITVDQNATSSSVGATIGILDKLDTDEVTRVLDGDHSQLISVGINSYLTVTMEEPVIYGAAAASAEFAISNARASSGASTFDIEATNGANYSPGLPEPSEAGKASDSAIQGNRIAWSEPNQPEHWPLVNRMTFGEGDLIRLVRAGDAVYAFSTDARIYRISGTHDNLRVDQVAENVLLLTPGSVTSHEGSIYAWTDQGLALIRDGFVTILTNPRLTDDFKSEYETLAGGSETLPWTWHGQMTYDRFHNEVWLVTGGANEGQDQPWIYNTATDEFYRLADATYALPLYVESLRTVFLVDDDPIAEQREWNLLEFVGYTSTDRMDAATIEFNRIDGGSAGLLKQWREFVLLFAPLAAGDQSITVTTTADKEVGGSAQSDTYTVTLDADEPAQMPCHVSRQTAMSAQQRLKLATTTASVKWALEGVVARADLLVDRTGAREA